MLLVSHFCSPMWLLSPHMSLQSLRAPHTYAKHSPFFTVRGGYEQKAMFTCLSVSDALTEL